MGVWDEMAENYDLIYGDKPDVEYYLLEAKNARGPVLEIGCGTGRILLRLLDADIEAYGIEPSEEMIKVLQKKAEDRFLKISVSKADMLDFSLEQRFRLIIVPYRTFHHLKNKEERKKALENFYRHLDKDGRLIMHLYNPTADDVAMTGGYHHFESEDLTAPEGKKYTIDWHLKYDEEAHIAHYKAVLTFDKGESFTYDMELYFFPLVETRDVLKELGYKNIRAYCGFDYKPFYPGCREVLMVAEK